MYDSAASTTVFLHCSVHIRASISIPFMHLPFITQSAFEDIQNVMCNTVHTTMPFSSDYSDIFPI